MMHKGKLISQTLSRFYKDKDGVAAIEFALIMPFLFGMFVFAGVIGTALLDKQDVTKKVRLGVEGLIRFEGDVLQAENFANATGQAAFSGASQSSTNDTNVAISVAYRCRSNGIVTTYTNKAGTSCANPESWYTVAASDTSLNPFGQSVPISERITFMGEW